MTIIDNIEERKERLFEAIKDGNIPYIKAVMNVNGNIALYTTKKDKFTSILKYALAHNQFEVADLFIHSYHAHEFSLIVGALHFTVSNKKHKALDFLLSHEDISVSQHDHRWGINKLINESIDKSDLKSFNILIKHDFNLNFIYEGRSPLDSIFMSYNAYRNQDEYRKLYSKTIKNTDSEIFQKHLQAIMTDFMADTLSSDGGFLVDRLIPVANYIIGMNDVVELKKQEENVKKLKSVKDVNMNLLQQFSSIVSNKIIQLNIDQSTPISTGKQQRVKI